MEYNWIMLNHIESSINDWSPAAPLAPEPDVGLASLRRWTGSWSLSSHEALPLSDLAGFGSTPEFNIFSKANKINKVVKQCKTWLQNVANMVAMLNLWSNKFPRFSPVLRRLKDCPISIDVVPPKGTNTNTSGCRSAQRAALCDLVKSCQVKSWVPKTLPGQVNKGMQTKVASPHSRFPTDLHDGLFKQRRTASQLFKQWL